MTEMMPYTLSSININNSRYKDNRFKRRIMSNYKVVVNAKTHLVVDTDTGRCLGGLGGKLLPSICISILYACWTHSYPGIRF